MKHYDALEMVIENLTSSLLKNSFYLMLTTLTGAGSGFFFWFICAKFYSPEEIGLAAAIISAMGILSVLSRMGLDIGVIRYLSDEEDKNGMINSCLSSTLLASTVVTFIFLQGVHYFSPKLEIIRNDFFLLIIFIVVTIANSLLVTQGNIFSALRSAKYSFLQNLVAVLRIIILPLLIAWGLNGIYLSYGVGIFSAAVLGNYYILKVLASYKPTFSLKHEILGRIIRFSFGNYIATIFEAVPNFLLPLLVLNILGAEQNGYFYISWSLSAVLLMIPRSTTMSLFAEGSFQSEKYKNHFLKSTLFIFVTLIPSICIFYIYSENILAIFGIDYAENAVELLQLFSVATIPYAINMLYITTRRIQKKVIEVICVYGFVGIFSIIGGNFLIAYYGLIGVAIAWALGNGIVAVIVSIIIYKDIFLKSSVF